MNYIFAVGSLMLLVETTLAAGGSWSHEGSNGPDVWYKTYPKCNGQSQSPIDVPLSKTKYDTSYGKINYNNYDKTNVGSYTLKNNGHAIQVDITGGQHTISGGQLPGTYVLGQFHFHWGGSNTIGSEHFIDGKQYPMELHFVHYSNKYSGIGGAVEQPNGLAVIGVMFQIGSENSAMNTIINNLNNVKHEGQSQQITSFALSGLLPGNPNEYFRYSGSLTTPTCDETVVWTVLNNPITVSQSQMDAFRMLYAGSVGDTSHSLVNNYRPVQALNGRSVYSSFPASGSAYHVSVSISTILVAFLLNYAV